MADMKENPDGTVTVELDSDEMARATRLAEERRAVPVSEVVEDYRWTTPEGYEIVQYTHRRVYPARLKAPRIVPGQTEEMRGWPCPNCGSTETSCWGVSSVPDLASFECRDCDATGMWVLECPRRPSPVHLDDECNCAPDCGCEYDPGYGFLTAKHDTRPNSDTTMTVPMTHEPGCSAINRDG
jgi:hypothetical protein